MSHLRCSEHAKRVVVIQTALMAERLDGTEYNIHQTYHRKGERCSANHFHVGVEILIRGELYRACEESLKHHTPLRFETQLMLEGYPTSIKREMREKYHQNPFSKEIFS